MIIARAVGILTNRRRRLPLPDPPAEVGRQDGLAYALWLPRDEPSAANGGQPGGVVILHGAGSAKESHYDFARVVRAAGMAAVAFDLRGHGESDGALGGQVLDDVASMAALLPAGPRALRGSSMGGYFALAAADELDAAAVVAICPAGQEMLLRGLRAEAFDFAADRPALERFLAEHPSEAAVAEMRAALLLLHAEGDERVPVEHSRALHDIGGPGPRRLIVVPGGHHRSVQHDAELQGEAARFIARAFATRRAAADQA